jgi:pSer/pThr/pTyr-binding forkhead associated (FHA) protein
MNPSKTIYVFVLSGPLKGRKYFVKFDSPILIGRDNDAIIKIDQDDYCSRKHALIYWESDTCFIEDLNSKNGTLINDSEIRSKVELKDGDTIVLGHTKLIVSIRTNRGRS